MNSAYALIHRTLAHSLYGAFPMRLPRGGDVHQRIRLLPAPLNDLRLLQLLRQADLMLDPFPLGSSFQTIALALSVGTPGKKSCC